MCVPRLFLTKSGRKFIPGGAVLDTRKKKTAKNEALEGKKKEGKKTRTGTKGEVLPTTPIYMGHQPAYPLPGLPSEQVLVGTRVSRLLRDTSRAALFLSAR